MKGLGNFPKFVSKLCIPFRENEFKVSGGGEESIGGSGGVGKFPRIVGM